MFDTPEWRRTSKYDKSNIPRHANCSNKRCQQGGIDLQMQVMHYPADGKGYMSTYSCRGHEGTPNGRRVGDPCMNSFTVSVTKRKVPTG
jgi:hypothetical protein